MKKFELYAGIILFVLIPIMDVMLLFRFSEEQLSLLFIILINIVLGWIAFSLVDSYIGRHEMHHWTIGYEDGLRDAKDVEDFKHTH
tara:strand:+ start:185 stop:442 length:258 start_codon:yes stop_codon:yes gene_type:complete